VVADQPAEHVLEARAGPVGDQALPDTAHRLFDALAGEILAAGGTRLLSLTFDVGGAAESERLSASGLLMVNPPYGFDEQMRAASEDLLPQLRQGPQARAAVEWLGGPD